ncbi:methyl-accepting chemotaxis protein [Thaumasiovibrio subtropicus]|uniref:methyl-accepting chemotaxis protein n=1 Tax=Thaumasiovibrio subtropicus TaxID=1891207 RepID=UPI000B3585F0|nr:methyl-accepting chemotaxis protein [Thaumasiovibrio subtropicus]
MKFVHKVIATSSVIVLISLSVMSAWQAFQVQNEIESLVQHSVDEIVSGVKNTVDEEIKAKEDLATYATGLLTGESNSSEIAAIIDRPVMKSNFLLVGIGFEKDGSFQGNDPTWIPPSDWDPRKRPWYQDAKQANTTIITAPYADSSTGEILVSVAAPVKTNGQFSGAIFYDVSLAEMAKKINSLSLFDAGYVFMVDSAGTIISHPETALNGEGMSSFLGGQPITTQPTLIDHQGRESLLVFTKINNQDWYVGVLLDYQKALSSVHKLRSSAIVLTVLCVVFTIAALFVVLGMLMRPLGLLNDAMKDAASGQGDLTRRLDTDTDAEFSELATNFNAFVEKLQSLISETKGLSEEIRTSTSITSSGSEQSASDMNQQLAEVEQLATAMNEMASSSMEVAGNAQGAANAAQEADNAVEQGVNIVSGTTAAIATLSEQIEQAVQVVSELQGATNNIESILVVINGIAEQTNLLALNAAIEAARAGDSGRGFAVVADEVRTLAQRTQESTTEIRNMIEQLQAGSQSATTVMGESQALASSSVETANEANTALSAIKASIAQISDMNLQIAAAAEQQSQVAEEINTNTFNIKDLSQQVSDRAKEASVQMQAQVERVEQQDRILGKFIV